MVVNMDAAVAFYAGTLGLQMLNRYGDHYAELQAPDLLIGLHPKSDDVSWGNNLSIGLGVTDFEGCVRELQAQGISIRVEQDGWIRLAHFADPDGNALFLAERAEN